MSPYTCNINNFLLAVIVILIITYTDNIFNNAPVLKKLFTDSVNYILIIILVILIILIDMPRGIIFAFMILYLSVYINYNTKKVKFADINTIINSDTNRNKETQIMNQIQNNNYNNSSASQLSESEFIYNNIKPFPNGNIMPFQPQEVVKSKEIQASEFSGGINPHSPDFITQVGAPNRDGFDISGCRYDFKNSPQNLTKYGPPLAQCATYSGEQSKSCGTVFYPLNG